MAVFSLAPEKTMAIALFLLGLFSADVKLTSAEVYEVRDSDGWTVGHTNYTTWASSKTFHVGDTIMFKYNKKYHNVLEVSRANFHACNASSPIATHATGNDTIILKKEKGHYYFICGFSGHCNLGQKVDIRVHETVSSSPSPLPAPPTTSQAPNSLIEGATFALVIAGAAVVSSLIVF